MRMKKVVGPIPLTVLVLALAGCDLLRPERSSPEEDLIRNRATWAAVDAASYRYRLVRSCECLPAVSGPFVVTVSGGEIVAAESEWSGEAVSAEQLQTLETVEELFAHVQEGIRTRATRVDVEYHPVLGYPTKVHVVHAPMVDEPVFEAGGLVVLSTG